jgi:hypothetical protein
MRSIFKQELLKANSDPADRRWIFVPYDQVTDKIGPLVREPAEKLGIILLRMFGSQGGARITSKSWHSFLQI